MTESVEQARELLKNRLSELNAERIRVEEALAVLGRGLTPPTPQSSRAGSSQAPPRRRRKSGTRADHALKVVKDSPGITPAEIAKELKIKPNYMYRVLHEMSKGGLVRKEGSGYVAA